MTDRLKTVYPPKTTFCGGRFAGGIIIRKCMVIEKGMHKYIPSKKSSAQVGVRVNSVLTRIGCIKCYISLFEEINL